MKLFPVPDRPILHLSGEREILVIADLHIGLEAHLSWKGFHMPSQTKKMTDELIRMSEGIDALVILGDIKHRVPGSTRQEHKEVPEFFDRLLDVYPRIEIVRGNHDANLEDFIPPEVTIHPASGFVLDGIGMVHGHTCPSEEVMKCRTVLTAHNHSRISFLGPHGSGPTEPCWLRIPFREKPPEELVVVPAFNPNLGGSPINLDGEGLLGPVLNDSRLDVCAAQVYLLDGVSLGKLGNLMLKGREYKKRKIL